MTGSPSSAPGVVERLLGSPEPSVRLKALLGVVGVADDADEARRARQEVLVELSGQHRGAGSLGR